MNLKVFFLLPTFVLSVLACFGQSNRFVLKAVRTATPPVIDGKIDEGEWRGASVIGDFMQFVPHRGEPASLRTTVLFLYDDDNLYFGFICEDPEPGKVQLGSGKRDGLAATTGTDSVMVELDTFNDDRTAFYFRTNPMGVQHDGRVTDNGRVSDIDWDAIWKSAGAWTAEGWSAEMAIPFRSVRSRPGKNQTWGIQFSRYIPRNIEKSFWVGPLDDYNKISNNGALVGLDVPESKTRPMFIPHIVSATEQNKGTDVNVGLDVRHALTNTVSGYLTVNPDFATVEADQEQVNLTPFELNLPEKRNFFIEGNDAYLQDLRLFYSRRVTDIYGGLKVYGKAGPMEISALTTETKPDSETGEPSGNVSALRLKRDIMGSSNIGFTAANRLQGGRNQGSFGVDATMYLTAKVKVSGQAAMSYGPTGKSDIAFFVKPSYDSTSLHADIRYQHIGERFGDYANALGYIPDDNRKELSSSIDKTFWMKKWNLDRIEYKASPDIYWGMDDRLRSWDVLQSIRADLRNKFSLEFRHDQQLMVLADRFRNHYSAVDLGYNERQWRSASLLYQFGKNFGSDFKLIGPQLKQNVTHRLSVQHSLSRLIYTPDPSRQSTWIHVIEADQYFTTDFFLKCFYQTNSAIAKKNAQVVFAYRFQPPFGLMQSVYQYGNSHFGETGSEGHMVFLKLAYVF